MNDLHGETGRAAARPDQKIDFLSQDQILYFSDRDVHLPFRIADDILQFPSQDPTFGIDLFESHLDSLDSCFRIHVAASGEVVDGSNLDRPFALSHQRRPKYHSKRKSKDGQYHYFLHSLLLSLRKTTW